MTNFLGRANGMLHHNQKCDELPFLCSKSAQNIRKSCICICILTEFLCFQATPRHAPSWAWRCKAKSMTCAAHPPKSGWLEPARVAICSIAERDLQGTTVMVGKGSSGSEDATPSSTSHPIKTLDSMHEHWNTGASLRFGGSSALEPKWRDSSCASIICNVSTGPETHLRKKLNTLWKDIKSECMRLWSGGFSSLPSFQLFTECKMM